MENQDGIDDLKTFFRYTCKLSNVKSLKLAESFIICHKMDTENRLRSHFTKCGCFDYLNEDNVTDIHIMLGGAIVGGVGSHPPTSPPSNLFFQPSGFIGHSYPYY